MTDLRLHLAPPVVRFLESVWPGAVARTERRAALLAVPRGLSEAVSDNQGERHIAEARSPTPDAPERGADQVRTEAPGTRSGLQRSAHWKRILGTGRHALSAPGEFTPANEEFASDTGELVPHTGEFISRIEKSVPRAEEFVSHTEEFVAPSKSVRQAITPVDGMFTPVPQAFITRSKDVRQAITPVEGTFAPVRLPLVAPSKNTDQPPFTFPNEVQSAVNPLDFVAAADSPSQSEASRLRLAELAAERAVRRGQLLANASLGIAARAVARGSSAPSLQPEPLSSVAALSVRAGSGPAGVAGEAQRPSDPASAGMVRPAPTSGGSAREATASAGFSGEAPWPASEPAPGHAAPDARLLEEAELRRMLSRIIRTDALRYGLDLKER